MDGKGLGLLRKGLLSALVIGALGGAASLGVLAAFSATTSNSGNEIVTGTVNVADNDNGAAVYNATGMRPGEAITRCIRVTYTGNLPATMRLYSAGTPGPLAPHVDLTITAGTQASPSFPSCTGFTADSGGQLFSGTLEQLELNRTGYANGIATTPGAATAWNQNDARVYRIVATLRSDAPNSVQGTSTGSHSFIWEARNN
jgi:hypothetical protein